MIQPEYLYKYLTIDRLEQILTQHKIFFPTPADFNDPFDCRFREKKPLRRDRERYARDQLREGPLKIPRWERRKITKQSGYVFAESYERFLDRIHQAVGILCLTEKRDNVLMWSHYAQKHAGVCLEFQNFSLMGSPNIPPLPVTYSDEYPVVNLFEMERFVNGSDAVAPSKQQEFVERIYLTKARDWQYECEWRVVDLLGAHFASHGRGFRQISPKHLTGVIFGCRTTEPDKRKIRELIALGNTHPKLYEAKESADSFALEIKAI